MSLEQKKKLEISCETDVAYLNHYKIMNFQSSTHSGD